MTGQDIHMFIIHWMSTTILVPPLPWGVVARKGKATTQSTYRRSRLRSTEHLEREMRVRKRDSYSSQLNADDFLTQTNTTDVYPVTYKN